MTTQVLPMSTVSFSEMLTFIGCEDSDVLWYSEVYGKYSEAINSSDFIDMLIKMGMDDRYIYEFHFAYFDLDLNVNIEVCEVKDTDLYLINSFD